MIFTRYGRLDVPRDTTLPASSTPIRADALRANPAIGMGAFTPVDSAARYLGVDKKTLLLIGVLGLVGGYLLNDAVKSAQRSVKRGARRARKKAESKKAESKKAESLATPFNLDILVVAGLCMGAAYWWYYRHQAPAGGSARVIPHTTPLPKLVNGHWRRPAP
jgi:hypothetical protein